MSATKLTAMVDGYLRSRKSPPCERTARRLRSVPRSLHQFLGHEPTIEDLSIDTARRWLVWKAISNGDKKPRKVPYYCDGSPRQGALDTPEDRARLATLAEARAALVSGAYAGLGFALGPDEAQVRLESALVQGREAGAALAAKLAGGGA